MKPRQPKTGNIAVTNNIKPLPIGSVRLMLRHGVLTDAKDHLVPHPIHATCIKLECEMIGYRVPEDFKYGV